MKASSMSNKPESIVILMADDDEDDRMMAAEEDICRTYNLGVNSFITKPVSFDGLVSVMTGLAQYGFEIVRLPVNCEK